MLEQDDLTPDYQLEPEEAEAQAELDIAPAADVEAKKQRKPRKEIDREVVIKLARLHCNVSEIARWFGVDQNTINLRFKDDIELARGETKAKLRRKMLEEAMNGNTTMLIWLSKNMLGFSDNGPIESDDKKPLPWTDA
jgi:hypothetical protein